MSNYEAEFNKASKTVQKQFSEAEERVVDTTRQFQSEWAKTLEEMNRTIMSRASAEMQLGANLSQKLSAARSPTDAVSAYQEWLTADMSGRSEVARQFMNNWQNFIAESTRLFSNGASGRFSR
jgi:seryl-tRNA synthetase